MTLLRQLINWIPDPSGVNSFVLTHRDFDIQNLIVSEDGELRGIIDWDGVAAVPRTLGNERYPEWLTRDWDPGMYGGRSGTGGSMGKFTGLPWRLQDEM